MAAGLRDLVFPPRCAACDVPLPLETPADDALCRPCVTRLVRVEPPDCPWCGAPVRPLEAARAPCRDCPAERPAFAHARVAVPYAGTGRALVLALKYGARPAAAGPLARFMAEACRRPPAVDVDCVAPVPLHWQAQRVRGFNQAELLATPVARALGAAMVPALLRRSRATTPQAGLEAEDRFANVADAFVVRQPKRLVGRRVLLVDDVLTTGATLDACARACLAAGAAFVAVAGAARAVLRGGQESFETADSPRAGGSTNVAGPDVIA